MIRFTTTIHKFDKQGEKTGWTFIEISAAQARKLNPGVKTGYRVRGKLDSHPIQKTALIPMGEGRFILPLKSSLRKTLGKKMGDKLTVEMELDERPVEISPALMKCLKDEPESLKFFKSLPGSHQRYYGRWIDDAKTMETKARRIAMALKAFSKQQGFNEMMRENKTR